MIIPVNRGKRMKVLYKLLLLILLSVLFVSCKEENVIENPKEKVEITFLDEEGNLLKTQEYEKGAEVTYDYAKESTPEWKYTFLGWSLTKNGEVVDTLTATQKQSYYAIIKKEKQTYTITFECMGGSDIATITKEYGEMVTELEPTQKEGFRFICWCTDKELTSKAVLPFEVTENITLYASFNEKVKTGEYLKTLLSGYKLNPYSYIPNSMLPENHLGKNDFDYTQGVDINKINYNSFGEQWNMIITNINESIIFFNSLQVIENLATTSVASFNNYLDSNPSDTASYEFASGIYNVKINFDGKIISYKLDYTKEIPMFGVQTVAISMSMDIVTGERDVYLQIGSGNKLHYVIKNDSYTFAIKYLGVRRAYFSVSRNDDGEVEGHISEYLTISGKGIKSAADFYVKDGYVSCVGNKASSMIGFTGYINELYDLETGSFIGYEIKEVLSKITYNTLWFNLSTISGINKIQSITNPETEKEELFVNGLAYAFASKKVGGLSTKTLSRRYDIEFRKQYLYEYDEENQKYIINECLVPMLFVQDEFYDSLANDVKGENKDLTIESKIKSKDLEKIRDDYKTLIDIFVKEKITEEEIEKFLEIN